MSGTSRAFSLIELLVVIGITTLLLGLLIAALARSRMQARELRCATNLRAVHVAFVNYATAYRGVVPRYAFWYHDSRGPVWLEGLGVYLGLPSTWDWPDLRRVGALRCPDYERDDTPATYLLNCFAFDTQPQWQGAPPMQFSRIRNPSQVVWMLEAAEEFKRRGGMPQELFEPHYIIREPANLEGGEVQRANLRRHRDRSNMLFVDGHVQRVVADDFQMTMLDDGLRSR
jgi:prepilin-type processing-associated H-X9-DG protein